MKSNSPQKNSELEHQKNYLDKQVHSLNAWSEQIINEINTVQTENKALRV